MTHNIYKIKTKHANTGLLLTSVSLIALYSGGVSASCIVPTGNATLTTPCNNAFIDGPIYNNGSLTNATTITGGIYLSFGFGLSQYSLANNFNANIPSPAGFGIYADGFGTINNLQNYGQISSGGTNASSIYISSDTTVSNLINDSSGIITASGAASSVIYNEGTISALQNSGVISGANVGINNQGNINSITNTGTILGTGGGASGINSSGGTGIANITNSGTISGNDRAITIVNSPAATVKITNTGTLSNTARTAAVITANINSVNFQQNSGVINGAIQLGANTVAMSIAGRSIFGNVQLNGNATSTLNFSGGSLNGALSSTQSNLVVNVNSGTLSAY